MDNQQYARDYSKVVRYAAKVPVSAIHPELRFTRLGAHLREHSQAEDTVGHLARTILTSDHSQPLELTPLHAMRDLMQENPEHPLAKAFNWERLPEKVALDQSLHQWTQSHPYFTLPMQGVGSIVHDPDSDFHGRNRRVEEALAWAHNKGHSWASREDVKDSARRVNSRMTHTSIVGGNSEDYLNTIHDELADDEIYHHKSSLY